MLRSHPRIRAEQPYRSAHQPCVRLLLISPPHSPRQSPPSQPSESHTLPPPPQPPAFPFSVTFSLFPSCSRQRLSTPSRSHIASVRPQPIQSLVFFFHFY